MNVVSNTSPLTNLALIGRLDLLAQLYGSLTIPDAVWHELVVKGGASAERAADCARVVASSTVGDEPGAGAVTAS